MGGGLPDLPFPPESEGQAGVRLRRMPFLPPHPLPPPQDIGADAHIGPTFRCRPGNKNGRMKASAPTKEKIAGNSETPTRNLWGRPVRPPAVNHPITKNVRQIHE